MSVLIKGATLQQVMRVIMHSTEWLSDDVEIVEVPKHGRLIDTDELEIERGNYETYNDYSEAFDMIDNAPTVIEAEGQKRIIM